MNNAENAVVKLRNDRVDRAAMSRQATRPFVLTLKIDPKFQGVTEVKIEAHRGVGGDQATTVQDVLWRSQAIG